MPFCLRRFDRVAQFFLKRVALFIGRLFAVYPVEFIKYLHLVGVDVKIHLLVIVFGKTAVFDNLRPL